MKLKYPTPERAPLVHTGVVLEIVTITGCVQVSGFGFQISAKKIRPLDSRSLIN